MAALLKAFGKGLLYILVLPILLVVLAVYIVLGVVIFTYIGIKAVFLYFTGRNLKELPEDIKARELLYGIPTTEEVELPKVEQVKEPEPVNDFVSNYYVPLDRDIPAPKEDPAPSEAPLEQVHLESKDINNNDNNGGEL